mgnify:CR=1 FL=1
MGIPGLPCEGVHQRCGPLCAPRYAGAPREHGFAMLGAPEVYAGLAAPATPDAGAPREHGFAMLGTRVTFPSRGKSPKARQGLRPLESPGAWSPPFSRSLRCAPSRAGLPSATTKDRFATLSLWANRSCFFPLVSSREHSLFSICGSAGLPPRMLEGLSSRNQYR